MLGVTGGIVGGGGSGTIVVLFPVEDVGDTPNGGFVPTTKNHDILTIPARNIYFQSIFSLLSIRQFKQKTDDIHQDSTMETFIKGLTKIYYYTNDVHNVILTC